MIFLLRNPRYWLECGVAEMAEGEEDAADVMLAAATVAPPVVKTEQQPINLKSEVKF